ncbi:MAG: HAMP domain-containing sensor histidine kinase [Elusimicrobia bacterium]|nr:HAMP domain-containing sensor histidine kinase [Elusimicrobiota bacterium]
MNKFSGVRNHKLLKRHSLVSAVIALLAGIFIFATNFPFPRKLGLLSFIASAAYFAYYLSFAFLCRKDCVKTSGIALSQMGVAVVTLAVLYTGGIVSPFIFLYFSLLVAEALYGLQNPYTMPAGIAGYLLVASGHYYGFLPNYMPWSQDLHHYPVTVAFISLITASYLALTGTMTGKILSVMRARLAEEAEEKEVLVRKFSELNSTTQLGVLAHRIAHDLRGPVASLSGYLEVQALEETDKEKLDTLRAMQETVDEVVSSLHNITRFGKPAGPSREDIRLGDFVRDLAAIIAFSPKARGVSFETKVPIGVNPVVNASKSDLMQAIFNIVKNAVEAVHDNADLRSVAISVSSENGSAVITVSDNGPGIPEEQLKNVFRRSVTTKPDGTGVGLLITRDLLIRNGGDIKLHNLPSGGLSVIVELPAAPDGA